VVTPRGPVRRLLTALATLVAAGATALSLTTTATSAVAAPSGRDAAGIRVSPSFFGLHDGSMAAYDTLSFGSIRLWDAGVEWRQVETSPGVYDWSGLDTLVRAAQAHGTEVTLVLAMTPSFDGPAANLPPTHLADYAAYARAAMTRYRDFEGSRGITAYEVWNEGNVPTFWQGTAADLARMTQVVDQVRDDVDPGATVLAPSFAVRYPGEQRWVSQYESQTVGGTPVWRFYDAGGFSLYPFARYGDRPGGPEDAMRLLGDVRGVLRDAGVPATKPVWATEINYGLKSGGPGQVAADPVSDRRQVANVLRTYLLGASRGLARVFWYRYDWNRLSDADGGGTLGNTLLTVPGQWDQVSPAGEALTTAEDWLSGRLVDAGARRPCATDRRGTYTCVVRYAGGTRTIYWNPTHKVRVQVRGAVSREGQNGVSTPLTGKVSQVTVGFRPIAVVTR
jgi:polysaccharide biosynthesis protein PslG